MRLRRYERALTAIDDIETPQCAVTYPSDDNAEIHRLCVVETERSLGQLGYVVGRHRKDGETVEPVVQRAGELYNDSTGNDVRD